MDEPLDKSCRIQWQRSKPHLSAWKGNIGRSIAILAFVFMQATTISVQAQNYERYRPLGPSDLPPSGAAEIPEQKLPPANLDDRILVNCLDAVVIVDHSEKVSLDETIDQLEGLHYEFDRSNSLVFQAGIKGLVDSHLGKPLSLKSLNQLARQIARQYKACGQPIVDIQIPEQRITGGTLHLVIIESKIGEVLIKPDCVFDCVELDRWIDCTREGNYVFESDLQSDLFWVNQNPFRRVSVDFQKGTNSGTTDVIYQSHDVTPIRGYLGMDDTGVQSLNYGRVYAGLMYGNLFNRGGTLSYQYTTDQDFARLKAHSVSYNQPVNRDYSFNTYGSWATVTPVLGGGLIQQGESWQAGIGITRHLERTAKHSQSLSAGIDFKSTNNNLEFSGSQVAASNADLIQLRLGFDDIVRHSQDESTRFKLDMFVGPGSGFTNSNTAAAFDSIRPGAATEYAYARFLGEDTSLIGCDWMLLSRLTGQITSDRLLFSETLGLGGFDTIRGFDQRASNGDSGWIANLEFGPKTIRWGEQDDPHSLRLYSFLDVGNSYIMHARAGEDRYTLAASTGFGLRFNVSDRLTARLDYGFAFKDIDGANRNDRLHLGFTWIPGERP